MASPEINTYNNLVHSLANEVPDLTEEEKQQLAAVLQKAKEFDEEEKNQMKKPIEGQLYKYTNVVKGWQFRWFILTPETGMLEYYMMEENKKNRPKGGLHLAGAAIIISEDDNFSFTVSAICGEMYKLKATDSRERQYWVSRLRATAERHTVPLIEVPNANKVHRSSSQSSKDSISISPNAKIANVTENQTSEETAKTSNATTDSLESIKECVDSASSSHKALALLIEQLPIDGPHLKCSDSSLLLLKATSQATVQSLEYCYLILQKREHERMYIKPLPHATVQSVNSKKLMNESSKK